MLRTCRERRGWTLRDLGERAATSHSALAAYEAGRKVPGADTLARVLRATGHDLQLETMGFDVGAGRRPRGVEIEEVLALADLYPSRHAPTLEAPIFGRR